MYNISNPIRFLFTFTILFLWLNSPAQIGLKVLQIRPAGEMKMTMKKTVTGEILWINDFEQKVRLRVGGSYASLKPRLDTFLITGIKENGAGTTVLPGYLVFHKYDVMSVSAGIDYGVKLNKEESFFIYPGIDLIAVGVNLSYDEEIETLHNTSYSGLSASGGIGFRIGTEYLFKEKVGVFLEATQNVFLLSINGNQSILSLRDLGLGIRYNFY